MNFEKIVKHIFRHEGGFVDHADDHGGPTNFGITQKTLTNHLGRHASVDDVIGLTRKQAEDIYEQHYYHYPRIDQLPGIVQPIMVDMAVNHGPRQAVKILQDELQHDGYNVGKIDGVIGSKTIQATGIAVAEHHRDFVNYLIERRLLFYKAIIDRDESQRAFWHGWMKRAEFYRPDNAEVYG